MGLGKFLKTFLTKVWQAHELHEAKERVRDLKNGIHRTGPDHVDFRLVDGSEQARLLAEAQKQLDDLSPR